MLMNMKDVRHAILIAIGVGLLLVLVGGFFLGKVHAGGVTDNNNGNAGDFFLSTGRNHGKRSEGTWTDPKDIPGLKGEKGDKGERGEPGIVDQEVLDIINNRIDNSNKMRVTVTPEINFIRGKNHTIGVYGKVDVLKRENKTHLREVGLRITIGLGKSWEQKELERLEKKINNLGKTLERMGGEGTEATVKRLGIHGYEIEIDEPGMKKILRRF